MNALNIPADRMVALTTLLDGPATRADLDLSPFLTNALIDGGVIKPNVRNGKPVTVKHTDAQGNLVAGRPRHTFRLTDNGRKRVKRFAARMVGA